MSEGFFLMSFWRIKTETCWASQIKELGQVFIMLFLCNSSNHDIIQVVKATGWTFNKISRHVQLPVS